MGIDANTRPENGRLLRLRIEFAALFLGAPIFTAVALPPERMFTALFVVTGLGLVLLSRTPGFRLSELWRTAGQMSWSVVLAVAAATAVAGFLILWWTSPDALFALPRRAPGLMLMIAVGYPILSALPQELIFRPLFFRRYNDVLPATDSAQIILNAGIFALAHLMYWSWIVALMTFVGGLVFAWSYKIRGNFAEAVVAHSVAGVILFALGMGVYFYSGAVVRPF